VGGAAFVVNPPPAGEEVIAILEVPIQNEDALGAQVGVHGLLVAGEGL